MAFSWDCDQQVYKLFYIWGTHMNLHYEGNKHWNINLKKINGIDAWQELPLQKIKGWNYVQTIWTCISIETQALQITIAILL